MKLPERDIIVNKLPKAVKDKARQLGITDADCMFAIHSDLTINARPEDVWMIVTREQILALGAAGGGRNTQTGPFSLSEVAKVRTFQTVGSACPRSRMPT